MAVLNARTSGFSNGIYIGRPMKGIPGSVLGNPFKMGPDGSRVEVIQKYRQWLWNHIQNENQLIINELLRIHDSKSDVICWCAPLPCHGDVVLKAADYLASKR